MAVGDGSTYPTSIDNFTDPQDKVDVFQAGFVSDLNRAVNNIETELGADVAGSKTDLVTRLAQMIGDNGSVRQGSSFPGSGEQGGDLFFRTDEDVVYFRNNANNDWLALGQSLSNVIYCWTGNGDNGNGSTGTYVGTAQTPSNPTTEYHFLTVRTSTLTTVIVSKYTHISGVTNVVARARIWQESASAGRTATVSIDIGGASQTATGSAVQQTPEWVATSNIDVSGLTPGTTYDITIQLKSSNGDNAYLSDMILIAS